MASKLLNIKTVQANASDIIMRYQIMLKKTNIKGILTKFFDQRPCKELSQFLIK